MRRTLCASAASLLAKTERAVEAILSSTPRSWGKEPPDLVLLFASPRHDTAKVSKLATAKYPDATVIASSTAGELTESGTIDGGIAALLVKWGDVSAMGVLVDSIQGDAQFAKERLLGGFRDELLEWAVRGRSYPLTLLFGNALSPQFEKLVIELEKTPFDDHIFAGAGSADDGALLQTVVALGNAHSTGGAAALHAFSKRPWGVGLELGFVPSATRMSVTRAVGERVFELDGAPAMRAYETRARSHFGFSGPDIAKEVLLTGELGILLFDELVTVRSLRRIESDGSVVFDGPMPEGSTACFIDADRENLVSAASRAAKSAAATLEGPAAGVLVFSSVSRRLRLKAHADLEIAAVAEVFPDTPIAGFASYAEIARTPMTLGGYYNSGIVVIAIPA